MDGDRLIYGAENGLSRRGALTATVVGSAFALSVQPVSAQTITTPADGLTAGVVKVKTKDGKEMDAYRAMPATGTALGTVLVVQEIFGVHAHIADLCRRLAKAGYYAISPELYFRQGDPKTYTEIPKLVSELVSKVPDEQVWAASIRPSPSPRARARPIRPSSPSPASAGAAALCGCTRHTTRA